MGIDSNIFTTDDVLNLDRNGKLYHSKGVYISGLYRPPSFSQNLLMITNLHSNRANVINYTSQETDIHTDSVLEMNDIVIDTSVDIDEFTQDTRSIGDDNTLMLSEIYLDTEPDIEYYQTAEQNTSDHIFSMTDFSIDIDYGLDQCEIIKHSVPGENLLMITNLHTNRCVVTNYNS